MSAIGNSQVVSAIGSQGARDVAGIGVSAVEVNSREQSAVEVNSRERCVGGGSDVAMVKADSGEPGELPGLSAPQV